jgi:hypothetical protein
MQNEFERCNCDFASLQQKYIKELVKENWKIKKELSDSKKINEILIKEKQHLFNKCEYLGLNYIQLIKDFKNQNIYIMDLKRAYEKKLRQIHEEEKMHKKAVDGEKSNINTILQEYSYVILH